MKKIAITATAMAALLSSTSALAGTSGWMISEASGDVVITRDGKSITGRKGTRLDEGDLVQTFRQSRAVLVRGSEYVVVSPKAKIKIAEPEKAGPVTQIFQYLGNALFKIEKKSKPHFGVETPYMAAVVKGTTFNVSVTEEGTSVQVTEGAVEVVTPDDLEAALLTPGIVGVVEADDLGDLVVIVSDSSDVDRERIIVRGTPNVVSSLDDIGEARDRGVSISESASDNNESNNSAERKPASLASNFDISQNGDASSSADFALGVPQYRDDAVTDGGILAVAAGGQDDLSNAVENDFAPDSANVSDEEDAGDDDDGNDNPGNGNGRGLGLGNGGDDDDGDDDGDGDGDEENADEDDGNSNRGNENGNGLGLGLGNGDGDELGLGFGNDDGNGLGRGLGRGRGNGGGNDD